MIDHELIVENIKNFEKNNILKSLQKLELGECLGFRLCSVNGDFVKLTFEPDFCEAGHGLRYNFIPVNEIWVDNNIHDSDYAANILHEIYEFFRMKELNEDYDTAHKHALQIEIMFRREKRGF